MVTVQNILDRVVRKTFLHTEMTTFCEIEFDNGYVCVGHTVKQKEGTETTEECKELALSHAIQNAAFIFVFVDQEMKFLYGKK